jgi:hypothetical protein
VVLSPAVRTSDMSLVIGLSDLLVAVGGSGGCGRGSASVSRGRSRAIHRWRAAPRDQVRSPDMIRGWLAASPPVSTHQDWSADC